MGIEPTRSLFPDPSLVLKTRPGTSLGRAPGIEAGTKAIETLARLKREFKTLMTNWTANSEMRERSHRNQAVSLR